MSADRKRGTEFQLPPLMEVSLDAGVRIRIGHPLQFYTRNHWVVIEKRGVHTLRLWDLMFDFQKYKDEIGDNQLVFNPRSRNRAELNVYDPVYLLLSWEGRTLIHEKPGLVKKVTEHGPFSEMSFYDAAMLYSEPLGGGRTPFPAHPFAKSIYIPRNIAN
ncbi:MAG: hypothetical protein HY426_05035 [Candidatus Levybacteria bacterium]|nr:hypothetical protein [Candidatus Levybacteria bacterium]